MAVSKDMLRYRYETIDEACENLCVPRSGADCIHEAAMELRAVAEESIAACDECLDISHRYSLYEKGWDSFDDFMKKLSAASGIESEETMERLDGELKSMSSVMASDIERCINTFKTNVQAVKELGDSLENAVTDIERRIAELEEMQSNLSNAAR